MLKINHWVRAVVIGAAVVSSAVAHANMRKIGFHRAAAGPITSIDVLDVVQQQPLMVLPRETRFAGAPEPTTKASEVTSTIGNPSASLDGLQQSSAKLQEGFVRQNLSLGAEFARQLVSSLRAAGYDAKALHGQKPRDSSIGPQQTIAGVNSNADAVLYVVIRFAGYKDDVPSGGLVPMAGVDAYLFNTKDGKLLYRQVLNSGYKLVESDEVEYPALPAQKKFSNRAALMSNADSGAKGLVEALQPIADRIAEQLGK